MNVIKPKFDADKLIEFARPKLKYLPAVGIFVITITFVILSFLALYPQNDASLIAEGEARLKSLDIRFDTKLLKELETTKAPTQLGTAGGRDPFSSF